MTARRDFLALFGFFDFARAIACQLLRSACAPQSITVTLTDSYDPIGDSNKAVSAVDPTFWYGSVATKRGVLALAGRCCNSYLVISDSKNQQTQVRAICFGGWLNVISSKSMEQLQHTND